MVVNPEPRIVPRNRYTFACAGHQTSPANPYRHQKGRTRWDALGAAMGPDHRERASARNAFLPGPPGRASILPAVLRNGYDRQAHLLGLISSRRLPGLKLDLIRVRAPVTANRNAH